MCKKLIVIIMIVFWTFIVFANDKPVSPPAKITFGLYENGFIYDKTIDDGIDKALAVELGRRSGREFEFIVHPRARIWKDLEYGRLMMTGSGIQNVERDNFAWFIRCMGQKNYVLIHKDINISSANDYLKAKLSKMWGAIRLYKHGKAADEFLDKLRLHNRVYALTDMDHLFRMLSAKRSINAGFAPPSVYPKYFKQYGLTDKIKVEDWFPEDASIPHCLVFSKKHFSANDMLKWRLILNNMRKDGTLEKIYEKFLGKKGAKLMMDYKEMTQNFE